MALKVIGAGFGRTGTESLKAALEKLGLGPCDHMFELIKTTWRVEHLEALERGEPADLEALFDGFESAVDFPFALYYRQLMEAYPDAKVILTVRDPHAWYASAKKTILRGIPPGSLPVARVLGLFNRNARGIPRWWSYVRSALFEGFFEGKKDDEAFMTALFTRWNNEVVATVPPERLLVFQVKDGWEPLCAFLGVAVPDEPFPKSNDAGTFEERTKLRNMTKTVLGPNERAR
jgi:hypothetical protein